MAKATPKPKAKGKLKNRPSWLPTDHYILWDRPWTIDPDGRVQRDFKGLLWKNGYITPNFTREEAKSGDGVQIPGKYQGNAQRHGIALERVRHSLGDEPLKFRGWYRSPAYNRRVGGVEKSQHLLARATDWDTQTNQARFNSTMRRRFANGGIGSSAVNGRVIHVDNGPTRRWTYPAP